jgi:DNA-binding transcriptional regulator YiaG
MSTPRKKSTVSSPVERSLSRALTQAKAYLAGDPVAISETRITVVTVGAATAAPAPKVTPKRVRTLRDQLGLSQPLFAEALNVSRATVQGWEQGTKHPSGAARRLLEIVAENPDLLRRRVQERHAKTRVSASI